MHEPEFGVLEIEIMVEAAPLPKVQVQLVRRGVVPHRVSQAGLEDAEHPDEALLDVVTLCQPAGKVFLALKAGLQIAQRSATPRSERRRGGAHPVGETTRELSEVLQTHTGRAEIPEHERRLIEVAQAAPQSQSIVAGNYTRDIRAVLGQKPLHAAAMRRSRFIFHTTGLSPWRRRLQFRLRRQPR